MSSAIGPGGTIPWECLNCGNTGLIGMDEFEYYKQAFKEIPKQTKLSLIWG